MFARRLLLTALVCLVCGASLTAWALPYVPAHWKVAFADRVHRISDDGALMREGRERIEGRFERAGVALGAPIFIRIFKEEAELELWARSSSAVDARYVPIRTFPICYFSGPLGPKLREGDGMSPEGFYAVSAKQLLAASRYHRAFNIAFPNAYDRAHGRTGSYLMVHGDCVSIGCYAMTDEGISEIYTAVDDALRDGQDSVPVHIFPFRMNKGRMDEASGPWLGFWQNLKEGYDAFETERVPPRVGLRGKRYVFDDAKARPIRGW